METLNTIQQLAPATAVAAVLVLPWATAFFMNVTGAAAKIAHDDQWKQRASAAARWAGTLGVPHKTTVFAQINARRAQFATALPEAA